MLFRNLLVFLIILSFTNHLFAETQKKITVDCKSPWHFFGIVENLRSERYEIPERLDEIEKELCFNLNVAGLWSSGAMPAKMKEGLEIIRNMDWRSGTASVYEQPEKIISGMKSSGNELPVYTTDFFFKNKILTVGLKAYPYLIDYDCDGVTDLLVGDHDGFVYIYYNRGTNEKPQYSSPVRLQSASTGKDIAVKFNPKMSFADMNGDGKSDIILGAYDGTPYMIPNEAPGKGFVFDDHKFKEFRTKKGVLNVGNYAYPLAVDWDKDGLYDLLVGEITGKVLLYRNCGKKNNPLFMEPELIVNIAQDMYPDPVFIDINGDEKRDLLLGSRKGNVYCFLNIGTDKFPRFSEYTLLKTNDGFEINTGRLSHIHSADWNNDGVTDILIGNDDGEIRVFTGIKNKKGLLSFAKGILLTTNGDTELIAKTHPVISFGDLNRDGKNDIVAGGEGTEIRFYPNSGSNKNAVFKDYELISRIDMKANFPLKEKKYWENKGLEFITEYLGNISPEIIDWNNDGRPDILAGHYSGLIYFLKNKGTKEKPEFEKSVPLETEGRLLRVAAFSTPRAVDWNDDGLTDIITGDLYGRIHIYLNTGTKETPILGKENTVSVNGKDLLLGPRSIVEFADINGDGLSDLIVGNRFGKVYVLLNKGKKSNPEFKTVELMRDSGKMWEQLYGGGWTGPSKNFPLKWKKDKDISELCVEATSCPRLFDFNDDGKKELYISQRFGRIFLFKPLKQPPL